MRIRTGRTAAALVALAALLVAAAPRAQAATARIPDSDKFGLGVGIGALSYGLSGKYYISPDQAIQANLGTYVTGDRGRFGNFLALGADYLFEFDTGIEESDISLSWYLGPGLGAAFSGEGYWGVDANLCVGAAFLFHELPLDFALEYRPGLRLQSPGLFGAGRLVYTFTSLGLHLRYYF